MCGIAGFNFHNERLIRDMTDAMRHRGPDGEGTFSDDSVSLGHRRLSILDLSEKGRQPMRYKDLYITFNGEIYNFQEVKADLLKKGHQFMSHTDTEVILHAYEEWGRECVRKFNGMWAFCIYDQKENIFFLSRDRFGVKPLYYYFDGTTFLFASELTAIRKHNISLEIDPVALNFYFYQKYIGGELTIFKNCYKLLPSHNAVFNLEKHTLVKEKYFDLENEIKNAGNLSAKVRIQKIQELLEDAVRMRLVADVPVGSFLSGGIDSSIISAIIAQHKKDLNTFSIGFREQSYDEVPYSQFVADHIGTKHHVQYMDIAGDDILNSIQTMDEPFGDSSFVPTYLLSKITREKVTVSLSGDGADEVFGGYDTYQAYKIAKFIPHFLVTIAKHLASALPVSRKKVTLGFKMKKFFSDYDSDIQTRHLNWMSSVSGDARKKLLGDYFVADRDIPLYRFQGDNLLSIQLNDVHNYLSGDILKKLDMASMHNSLEARVPYLDYRLAPLVLSLPEHYKISGLKTKWLLKKIARRFLPASIIGRRKRGFTVPISLWIQNNSAIQSVLTEDHYYKHNIIHKQEALRLYGEHRERKNDHSRQLWLIFVFNVWCKHHYDSV